MADNLTAPPSVRWTTPEQVPAGYWVSYLKYPLTPRDRQAGLEPRVYGPAEWACIKEAHRQDTLWTLVPVQKGDREGHAQRVAFLASGGADGDSA